MSTYFVGDVHGCYNNLRSILDRVNFDPNIDVLYLTGDLVARGPNSLQVLRLIRGFNKNAKTVLGNHDLYLLKIYFNKKYKIIKNQFDTILNAPDIDELMHWLRHQSILYINENKKILMSHAGIHPNWNINQAKKYSQEIEDILTSTHPNLLFKDFTQLDISHTLNNTNFNIYQINKIKAHLNVFTKMRYIHQDGSLNLQYKGRPEFSPKNIYPWFNLSKRYIPDYSIIFGHWATLKYINMPSGIYGLDSGCCWGDNLTLLRWEDKKITQVPCSPPS